MYLARPTAYIIFFHRNETSVPLPLSKPVAITLPSRTQISISIKILLLLVISSIFFNFLISPTHL